MRVARMALFSITQGTVSDNERRVCLVGHSLAQAIDVNEIMAVVMAPVTCSTSKFDL